MKTLHVGLIGHKFMGKAHTHAYTDLPIFYNPGVTVVKETLCANEADVEETSVRWGWNSWTLDWHDVVNDPQIDIVDIAAPSSMHAEIAIAAARAGKHIFCEKPLALTLEDARRMADEVKKAGVVNMIGFNFRRVPALALAKQLIDEGRIGRIYHFRGIYSQDWLVDPNYPIVWRLQKNVAGYGTHGDMGAHVVDLARFLVGDIEEVLCEQRTFNVKRPLPLSSNGLFAVAGKEMGTVDVDDASVMLLKFKDCDAMGYIEVTRNATGNKNQNRIEVYGSKGGFIFEMERMDELKFYDQNEGYQTAGFRTIQTTDPRHPYISAWWPAGHIIGYGDSHVNQTFDFITAIVEGRKVKADFEDGYICQEVLEAAQRSSETRTWVNV